MLVAISTVDDSLGLEYTEAMGNKKLQLRLTPEEWRALELMVRVTGEDYSALTRRALTELAAKLLATRTTPTTRTTRNT